MHSLTAYDNARAALADGWQPRTVLMAVLGPGYRPDPHRHRTYSDLTDEVAGLPRGGSPVTRASVLLIGDEVAVGGERPTLGPASYTARYAAFLDGDERRLLGLLDFGQDVSPVNSSLRVDVGLLRFPPATKP